MRGRASRVTTERGARPSPQDGKEASWTPARGTSTGHGASAAGRAAAEAAARQPRRAGQASRGCHRDTQGTGASSQGTQGAGAASPAQTTRQLGRRRTRGPGAAADTDSHARRGGREAGAGSSRARRKRGQGATSWRRGTGFGRYPPLPPRLRGTLGPRASPRPSTPVPTPAMEAPPRRARGVGGRHRRRLGRRG